MTTLLTSQQAIDLLRSHPEAYTTPDELRVLAAQVDADAPGRVTMVYSRDLANGVNSHEAIQSMIADGVDIRVIDNSQAAKFLDSRDFKSAVAKAYGIPPRDLIQGGYRGPATDWLFNASNGPWADASDRFIGLTKGEIYGLINGATPDRVFNQTELKRAMDTPDVPSVEGIPTSTLRKAAATLGPQAPFEMTVAQAQERVAKLQIAVGADGAPLKNANGNLMIDPRNYFADIPGMTVNLPTFRERVLPRNHGRL